MTISSRSGLPRRSFLRTTAGAAVLASAPLTRPASARTDADDEPAGYLVFTYDDGTIEDYEKTFRVHEEYDVPGCVAASPGMLGSSDDWTDPDQLREMYDAGWEVFSHTIKHRAIGEIPIEADVSGDDCYVRYTDEFTREILAESKSQLEEIVGEDQVTGFVYPYERHDGLATEIVPEYYETTPRAFTGNGLNPAHGSDPFSISREYYEEGRMNEEELGAFLDTVANEPDFGILASHSSYDTLTEERISTAIEMALDRDIAIVTLQEALDIFGIVEAPDRSAEAVNEDADEVDAPEENESQEPEEGEEEQSEGLFDRFVAFIESLFDSIVGPGE